MLEPIYKRVLIKLSGEALQGSEGFGIDPRMLNRMALEISGLVSRQVQVALVVGGGNLYRGRALVDAGIERVTADHMGMLATVMNALALRDAFERATLATGLLSAIPMPGIAEGYDRRKAIGHLQEGRVVLLAAGTGHPLFTTDTAASLRAIELGADILLKATQMDGVYTSDPKKDQKAQPYKHLTYREALSKELGIMDLSAFCQCRDYGMKIRVFSIKKPGALMGIVLGAEEGTLVTAALEEKEGTYVGAH